MAVNKVVYGSETLVDLTNDTVTPETLAVGVTAHDASGKVITGAMGCSIIDESGHIKPEHLPTDETLSYEGGVLKVNTAKEPDPDNTLPITSAAVAQTVGNIEIILATI